MGVFDNAIATAERLIAKYGQDCSWRKPTAVTGDPWKPQPSTAPAAVPVKIAWFSPRDAGRGSGEFLALMTGAEVPSSREIGLMAGGVGFTPELTDFVVRGSAFYAIEKLDRIAPNGEAVLWYVMVKQ